MVLVSAVLTLLGVVVALDGIAGSAPWLRRVLMGPELLVMACANRHLAGISTRWPRWPRSREAALARSLEVILFPDQPQVEPL
jgi:hypothetical protein